MKFYDCETAPSPRRVRIFAAEKNIRLQKVAVNLADGEQFSDRFRSINPDCTVPALQLDDGTVITEVTAICQYLDELYPEPPLFGSSPANRARVTMWNIKAEQQGLLPAFDAFRNRSRGFAGRALTGPDSFDQIPELAERSVVRARAFMERMNGELANHEFLAGDEFSIADITALTFMAVAIRLKIELPADLDHLERWHSEMSSRESAAA
jgi:glutathione S-transferase